MGIVVNVERCGSSAMKRIIFLFMSWEMIMDSSRHCFRKTYNEIVKKIKIKNIRNSRNSTKLALNIHLFSTPNVLPKLSK